MVALDETLWQSYLDTDYVVFSDPEIVVWDGLVSDDLRAMFDRCDVADDCGGLFITAFNPYSDETPYDENERQLARLVTEVNELGSQSWTILRSTGRDPNGKWVEEPGLFIVGIDLSVGLEIGRKYRQHAVVWVARDGTVAVTRCKE